MRANDLAVLLNPGLQKARNLVRAAFLGPGGRSSTWGDASGQRLLIHSAEPGTPDGDKLALIWPGRAELLSGE